LIPEECRPAAQANDARPIRLLHLSDIHFRADKAWDAEPALRELASFVGDEVERTMLLERHDAYLDWYAGWLGAPPAAAMVAARRRPSPGAGRCTRLAPRDPPARPQHRHADRSRD
jgi:hypothetical protein